MDFTADEKRLRKLLEKGFDAIFSDDSEASWAEFETALAIDPDHPGANAFGAIGLYYMGRFDDAEQLAGKSVA